MTVIPEGRTVIVIPSREEHETWIHGYLEPRYPELVEPYRASLNGFERIKANDHVDEDSLMSVVFAASSPRSPLSDDAIYYLAFMIAKYQEARDAVLRMSESTHWYVRFNALRCLSPDTPRNFAMPLVKKGLQDSSARVRRLAAFVAHRLSFSELIPELESHLSIEHNQAARSEIELRLRLLRDGYCLVPQGKEQYQIWISIDMGTIVHHVSQREIKAKGIQAIVSELRRESMSKRAR